MDGDRHRAGVCHICGQEIKRFAEHLSSKHHLTDHKAERKKKDERETNLIRNSFLDKAGLRNGLGPATGGHYTLDAVINFLTNRGFVITEGKLLCLYVK
jgi:hypothetical protein